MFRRLVNVIALFYRPTIMTCMVSEPLTDRGYDRPGRPYSTRPPRKLDGRKHPNYRDGR